MIRTQLSHLPSNIDVLTEFPEWVIQHCDQTSVVLDVGAGQDRNKTSEIIRQHVARLVGVDPDPAIMRNPHLDERYQISIEDFAKMQDSSFDCLYSMFVLEHVTHPYEFLSACRRSLKPNGMLFGVTPNLWHYFGMATKLSASLGVEDWLLERLVGAEVKDSYHFPTAYRLNSIQKLKRTLEQTGFQAVEFRYFDPPVGFEYCMPKLLQWFPSAYSRLVYLLGRWQNMGIIMFRATA